MNQSYIVIPLGYKVLHQMVETREITELHDKIIVATAKLFDISFITKDKYLLSLATIMTVWESSSTQFHISPVSRFFSH